jgi:hypothetical protein
MSSLAQKIAHLGDHLPYEVLMLRYTQSQVNKLLYPLDWNEQYESFAVHARSLTDFLSNENGSRNFNAEDFSVKFKIDDDAELRRVVNQDMNAQVFHFGKNRKSDEERKIDVQKVNRIFPWLMQNCRRLIEELDDVLKPHWHGERCDPDEFRKRYEAHAEKAEVMALSQQNQTTSTRGLGFWATTMP